MQSKPFTSAARQPSRLNHDSFFNDDTVDVPKLDLVPLQRHVNWHPGNETSALRWSTDSSQSSLPSDATKFSLPPLNTLPNVSTVVLQKWIGVVLEVGSDTLTARLITLVGEGGDQIAVIHAEEVDQEDRALIAPGAVFYWSIGYRDKPSGRERFSQIRMRRLPSWTESDLYLAAQRADALGDLLDDSVAQ